MASIIINKKNNKLKFWAAALLLSIYALIGWLRFQQTLRYWYYFLEINLWPHPFYLAISGSLIGIGYSLGALFHLMRLNFTASYLRYLGLLFLLWIWIDRIFVVVRESFIPLLPITILITICTILIDIQLIRKIIYKKGKN